MGVPVLAGVGVEEGTVTGGLLVGEPPPQPDAMSAAATTERPNVVFPKATSTHVRTNERTEKPGQPTGREQSS